MCFEPFHCCSSSISDGDVQTLSDSLTRGVVVQRKSPGMEGSREVERALADNGQLVSEGRPELKNKTCSCVSLAAKAIPQGLSSTSAGSSHP